MLEYELESNVEYISEKNPGTNISFLQPFSLNDQVVRKKFNISVNIKP